MIFCPNCGGICDDNSNFCSKCGFNLKTKKRSTGLENTNIENTNQILENNMEQSRTFVPGSLPGSDEPFSFEEGTNENVSGKQKGSMKILVPILLLLILIAGIIAIHLFERSSRVIDLEKCVNVAFLGYDGDGEAVMTINTTVLEKQIKAAKGAEADRYSAESMADCVKLSGTVKEHAASKDTENKEGELEENDIQHLSRGDIITVTIDYSELQKQYKEFEFSGRDIDVEVREGLKDYTIIDPFIHVEPEFSGTSPFGEAGIRKVSDKIPPELIDFDAVYWYEINKVDNIAIGDTIVLTFTEEGKHDWKEKGLKPSRDEMEYIVTENDLPKYVTEMEEISSEDMVKMQAEARDRVVSFLVNYQAYVNTEYQGAYLMVPKRENWDAYINSYLIFVFKSRIPKSDDTSEDMWLAVKSSDLRKLKASDQASDIYDDSAENKVFDISDFSDVNNYDSLEQLKNDLILRESMYERDVQYVGQ